MLRFLSITLDGTLASLPIAVTTVGLSVLHSSTSLISIVTVDLALVVPLLSLTVYVKLSEPEYSLSGVYFTVSPDTDDN